MLFIYKWPPSVQLSCFVSSTEVLQQTFLGLIKAHITLRQSLLVALATGILQHIVFCQNSARVVPQGQLTITGLCHLQTWHRGAYAVPKWESMDWQSARVEVDSAQLLVLCMFLSFASRS